MKKILLVEDDRFLVKVYEVKLRALGMDVIVLYDGSEVMNTVKRDRPDVVLLDIMMPKEDGFDVIKEMKRNDDTKHVPIIVLTGLKNEEKSMVESVMRPEKYMIKTEVNFNQVIEEIKKYL